MTAEGKAWREIKTSAYWLFLVESGKLRDEVVETSKLKY